MPTFNTTDPKPGYVYDSAIDTWFPLVGIAPGSSVVRWRKTAEGGETSFTGLDDLGATLSYNAGTEQVYLNGVLLVRTEDYLATTGTSVTNLGALAASDVIEVISFNATNVQITDALLETDINAKGDLIVGAGVDTAAILASGTNGQVLKVNTATTSGLEWGSIDADIEGVTAGTGISGGGTSGTVTITNSMATAIDAKGDLIAGTGADAFAKISVGTDGQVLTAASGEATGLSWATPAVATASFVEIATSGTLSGSSYTFSGISGYSKIYARMFGVSTNTSGSIIWIRLNGDTGSNYKTFGTENFYNAALPASKVTQFDNNGDTNLILGVNSTAAATLSGYVYLDGCNSSGIKIGTQIIGANTTNDTKSYSGIVTYSGTGTISSVTIETHSGSFDAGSVTLFGSVA
jgi:hypothetical protein